MKKPGTNYIFAHSQAQCRRLRTWQVSDKNAHEEAKLEILNPGLLNAMALCKCLPFLVFLVLAITGFIYCLPFAPHIYHIHYAWLAGVRLGRDLLYELRAPSRKAFTFHSNLAWKGTHFAYYVMKLLRKQYDISRKLRIRWKHFGS